MKGIEKHQFLFIFDIASSIQVYIDFYVVEKYCHISN